MLHCSVFLSVRPILKGMKEGKKNMEEECRYVEVTRIIRSVSSQSGPDRAMTHLRDAAKTRH